MLNKSPRDIFKAASIVSYEHHERFDGHGYPRRLQGQEIHLYGRITAIADVFDSLASTRCYKKAWDLDRVIDWIKKESGRQFDPELVDIFLDVSGKFVEVRDAYRDERPAAV
jgi:response regulator RpfG family c-di-GMP phosphodiesterase